MLPFTKRPGRGEESGDPDVVTKDDVAKPVSSDRPSAAKASGGRGKFVSVNDEEMTTLMKTKDLGDARPSPRPAAGAPPPSRALPSSPSSRPAAPPSRTSNTSLVNRSGNFAALEEDEDGRTVVRGAPKIVKRTSAAKMGMPTSPTTISPAAVIKATLESARAGVKPKGDHGAHLMAGPPIDLLEDLSDRHPADSGEHTAILAAPPSQPPPMVQGVKALPTQMLQPQAMPYLGSGSASGMIPPGSARPMSAPPPPMSQSGGYASHSGGYAAHSGGYAAHSGGYAAQSGGYAAQSGGYSAHYSGPIPSGSVSVPGVAMPPSMPAHFMVPQAPYSDARVADPPATAVTSRTRIAGRPATSWAIALAAFGLFVGVGAVAVMHGNDGGGLMETSASFVDPSRAAGAKGVAAAAQPAAAAPMPVPVGEQPATVGAPPVAVPPAAAPPVAANEAVAAPVVTTPPAPAPVAVPAAAPATHAVAAAPAPKPAPVAVAAAPAPRPAPAPAPVARPSRPAPAAVEEPVAAAPSTAKGSKPAKPSAKGSDSAVDEEQKKALKALQESQLETSF